MNPFIAKDDGKYVLFSITFAVVPYVGTWIEMTVSQNRDNIDSVVPYVGTWIEICITLSRVAEHVSFPTWERG